MSRAQAIADVIAAAREVEHRCREALLLLEAKAPLTPTGDLVKDGAADAVGRLHVAIAVLDTAPDEDVQEVARELLDHLPPVPSISTSPELENIVETRIRMVAAALVNYRSAK